MWHFIYYWSQATDTHKWFHISNTPQVHWWLLWFWAVPDSGNCWRTSRGEEDSALLLQVLFQLSLNSLPLIWESKISLDTGSQTRWTWQCGRTLKGARSATGARAPESTGTHSPPAPGVPFLQHSAGLSWDFNWHISIILFKLIFHPGYF